MVCEVCRTRFELGVTRTARAQVLAQIGRGGQTRPFGRPREIAPVGHPHDHMLELGDQIPEVIDYSLEAPSSTRASRRSSSSRRPPSSAILVAAALAVSLIARASAAAPAMSRSASA